MRTIEFRVWDGSKMSYNPIFGGEKHTLDDIFNNENSTLIWMQFTGLTDKNKNKIFEDDVLEFETQYPDGKENTGQFDIKYDGINKRIIVGSILYIYNTLEDYETWAYTDTKIIGNIHDNKELLNEI